MNEELPAIAAFELWKAVVRDLLRNAPLFEGAYMVPVNRVPAVMDKDFVQLPEAEKRRFGELAKTHLFAICEDITEESA